MALLYTFANLVLVAVSVAAFFLAVVIAMNQNFMAGLGASVLGAWSAGASLTMSAARLFKGGMPSGSSGSPLAAMGGGGNMLNAQGGGSGGSSGGGSGGGSGSLDGLQNGRATGASPTASNLSPGNASTSGSPSQATPSAQSSTPTAGGQSQATHSSTSNGLKPGNQTRKPALGFSEKTTQPFGGSNRSFNEKTAGSPSPRHPDLDAVQDAPAGPASAPDDSAGLSDLKE